MKAGGLFIWFFFLFAPSKKKIFSCVRLYMAMQQLRGQSLSFFFFFFSFLSIRPSVRAGHVKWNIFKRERDEIAFLEAPAGEHRRLATRALSNSNWNGSLWARMEIRFFFSLSLSLGAPATCPANLSSAKRCKWGHPSSCGLLIGRNGSDAPVHKAEW